MQKNVLLLGATGQTGRLLAPMLQGQGCRVSTLARNPEGIRAAGLNDIDVTEGSALDVTALMRAMAGKQVVVGILSGRTLDDSLDFADSITEALRQSAVERIIWVTGMGIRGEVPGEAKAMLDRLLAEHPRYAEAAEKIAACGTPYTLIRAAHLTDGGNETYFVQQEGEPAHSNSVDRIAVARFIADLIAENKGINESLGVSN